MLKTKMNTYVYKKHGFSSQRIILVSHFMKFIYEIALYVYLLYKKHNLQFETMTICTQMMFLAKRITYWTAKSMHCFTIYFKQ